MVETLGFIIDRHPKRRPRKMESYAIKNRMCPLYNINIVYYIV